MLGGRCPTLEIILFRSYRVRKKSSMATNEIVSGRSFWSELLTAEVYKRNQGRMVRQVTCLAIWTACFLGAWRFYETFMVDADFGAGWQGATIKWLVPALICLAGVWIGYRLVNWPRFADFLISVEAEMNKVSWPSWSELYRASLVVIFTIAFLALLLFGYDLIWVTLFQWLDIS
jgi:preprotein translocase subunit SecE